MDSSDIQQQINGSMYYVRKNVQSEDVVDFVKDCVKTALGKVAMFINDLNYNLETTDEIEGYISLTQEIFEDRFDEYLSEVTYAQAAYLLYPSFLTPKIEKLIAELFGYYEKAIIIYKKMKPKNNVDAKYETLQLLAVIHMSLKQLEREIK
jgi:hypothetical protein